MKNSNISARYQLVKKKRMLNDNTDKSLKRDNASITVNTVAIGRIHFKSRSNTSSTFADVKTLHDPE